MKPIICFIARRVSVAAFAPLGFYPVAVVTSPGSSAVDTGLTRRALRSSPASLRLRPLAAACRGST